MLAVSFPGLMRSLALPFPYLSFFKHEEQRLSLGFLPVVACHQPGPILPQRAGVCRRKAELSLEWLQHARMGLTAGAGSRYLSQSLLALEWLVGSCYQDNAWVVNEQPSR